MNAIYLGVIATLLCQVPEPAPLPEPAPQIELPPAAREVLQQLEEESAEAEKKLEAEIKKRLEKTASELKKVQDQLCMQGELDAAVAVREAIRALPNSDVPAPKQEPPQNLTLGGLIQAFAAGLRAKPEDSLPEAARKVCRQHRDEVEEFVRKTEGDLRKRRDKVIAELKKVQDHYAKQAKLDEALLVRDLIRQVHGGVVNALADPGYVNNPATDIGKVFYYDVVGLLAGQSIYGTDVYTTGSHLGMAAVHCGLLRPGQRGVVKVTILPGQANYPSTTRHGITSHAYGQWSVSFKVEKVYGIPRRAANGTQPDPGTLTGVRAEVGKTLLYDVTGSNTGSVWGTDIYTDDSSLATAAVHAGILAVGQRGVIRVTVLPGQPSYTATTRNGVTSGSWGNWTGSFRIEGLR